MGVGGDRGRLLRELHQRGPAVGGMDRVKARALSRAIVTQALPGSTPFGSSPGTGAPMAALHALIGLCARITLNT